MARVSKKVSAAQREAENVQHRICFSALERQEEKLSAEKAEIVKQRVAPVSYTHLDVFLSHSHKDEKDVIAFAGLLSDIGLKVFIDSCV